jgi:hypothetical protein
MCLKQSKQKALIAFKYYHGLTRVKSVTNSIDRFASMMLDCIHHMQIPCPSAVSSDILLLRLMLCSVLSFSERNSVQWRKQKFIGGGLAPSSSSVFPFLFLPFLFFLSIPSDASIGAAALVGLQPPCTPLAAPL